jgi:hypothetical protein
MQAILELSRAVGDLGSSVGEIRAFLGGSNHVQPPPQPQLPPRPPQQLLPPQPPSPAIATSGVAPQYGLPSDVHGSSSRLILSGGVPIQQIQFPQSPSPLPPGLFAAPPAYSSSTTQPWLPPPPSTSVGSSYGGAPTSGVLYGGTDGPLFHGSSMPSPYTSAAPVSDGGGPAYGGVPNYNGGASYYGGQPPFGASNYGNQGGQPPFGYDP